MICNDVIVRDAKGKGTGFLHTHSATSATPSMHVHKPPQKEQLKNWAAKGEGKNTWQQGGVEK